jgi:hypothetical protein
MPRCTLRCPYLKCYVTTISNHNLIESMVIKIENTKHLSNRKKKIYFYMKLIYRLIHIIQYINESIICFTD